MALNPDALPTNATPLAVRENTLLGGRVRLCQPARGYRAAIDPVLLAAGVPAHAGERVLDLGCGVGAAIFCLATRVPGLDLHGLDLDEGALALAQDNARLNGVSVTLHEGSVARPPAALRQLAFDQVMMNPPYYRATATASPEPGRDRARREGRAPGEGALADWFATALARLRPGGWLTLIHRAERLPELLRMLDGPAGAVSVLPVTARGGRAAGRVVLRARKGARAPFRLLAPLVMHEGERHPGDREHYTPAARAILREAAALDFGDAK